MPRNVRQKKRAERRSQAAAAANEAAQLQAKMAKEASESKDGNDQLDEHAMGDGVDKHSNTNTNTNNNNNTSKTSHGHGNTSNSNSSSSSSTLVVQSRRMKASRADPILVALSQYALRMSDAQLLHGPHWLNEAILNFYFAYLEEIKFKANDDFLFITPQQSQSMLYMDDGELQSLLVDEHKAIRKSFTFFAMNDGQSDDRDGTNYSLLVASRPDKCFMHFDSYGGSNTAHTQELVNNIKDVLEMRQARFRIVRCLQQGNDYDCGVHVMCMADQLTDYVNRYDSVDGIQPLHQDVIKGKRNQLIKLIASMSINAKNC